MRKTGVVFVLALSSVSFAQNPPPEFWRYWGDGQAELASYDLVEPHYGHPRRGVAIAIFVTEIFSRSARVKADPGKHAGTDEFPVMKLNLVKDFQTGIYDYHDMTSSFLGLGDRFRGPTKISFSSQEWCGNVYHELLFDERGIRSMRHSYFDGEGDQQTELSYPAGGVSADELFFWARQIPGASLTPGQSRQVSYLPSLQSSRDRHVMLEWGRATLTRARESKRMDVPAGQFEVETWSVTTEDREKVSFQVEKAAPHRIVRWETSGGETGALLASARMKYWQLNGPGGEAALNKLRLSPRPPRTT